MFNTYHDLKKNLISLGPLDSQWCKYSEQGEVLKVFKGALLVIKGNLVKGLYLLQGSTIFGVVSSSSSPNFDSNTIYLWHMHLERMSEVRISILSKCGFLSDHNIGELDFCEHCLYGKQTKVKFSIAIHKTKGTIEYIHSDL